MSYLIYIIVSLVYLIIAVEQICLLLRALLSWFVAEDNPLLTFLYYVTEPVIVPFRLLFKRFSVFDQMMIDIPYMVAVLFLLLLESVLPSVYL